MSSSGQVSRRVLAVVRIAWGSLLIGAPGQVVRLLGGADETASRRVLRLLGARHLVQGGVEALRPQARGELGAAVDGLHALSAAGFAVADRRWRRPALLDGGVASAFGAAGLVAGR